MSLPKHVLSGGAYRFCDTVAPNPRHGTVIVVSAERYTAALIPSPIGLAGPPYADAVPFARKLVTEFTDRVVWGTDWPHPHHKGPVPDDGQLVDLIGEIAPTDELRRKLMVDNPRRLYDKRVA